MARDVFSNASVKIGDIFVDDWGWEQTNIDFYQVVGLRGKSSVELRPIHSISRPVAWLEEKVKPDVGNFIVRGWKGRLREDGNGKIVRRVRDWGNGSVSVGSEFLSRCGADEERLATHYA